METDRHPAEPEGIPSPLVMIVEDDSDLAEEMAAALADYGMRTVQAGEWQAVESALADAAPDLMILDQRLGPLDTLPRLPRLRGLTQAPILVLTGNRLETDRIVALELGADDFLLKPISGRELVARVRAHLRRAAGLPAPPARVPLSAKPSAPPGEGGSWKLLEAERRLLRPDGTQVTLTAAEFDLLAALARRPGEVIGREDLTLGVLLRRWNPTDRSLDNLVLRLRQKLGEGGVHTISTVRNQGYVFTSFPDA
jgi:DNA-binding response OmpR family regulator